MGVSQGREQVIAIAGNVRPRRRPERSISSDGSVRIRYGSHELDWDVQSLTVEQVQLAFQDVLNLSAAPEAYLNGRMVKDRTVRLRFGDRLDFIKPRGRKRGEQELKRIAFALEQIASGVREMEPALRRIADHFDPPKRGTVGTPYVAERLGVSVRWISDLIRKGDIPKSCIVPRSGEGKYWRFWKDKIDDWIEQK